MTISKPSFSAAFSWYKEQPSKTRAVILAIAGWGLFFIYSVCHCYSFRSVIFNTADGWLGSFVWVLKEYGPWPVITPMLFLGLTRAWSVRRYDLALGLCVCSFLLAYGHRVRYDLYSNSDARLQASLVYFFSRHIAALLFILLGWALFFQPFSRERREGLIRDENEPLSRPAASSTTSPTDNQIAGQVNATEVSETLRVSKGSPN